LHLRLRDIGQYLQKVIDGDLPVNHAILANLQDVFNLLPNLSSPKPAGTTGAQTNGVTEHAGVSDNSELARAMSVKTNDQLMAIYLSSLIRAITAFHDLIENKIQNRQSQEEKDGKVEGVNGEAKKVEGEEKKEGAEAGKAADTANGEKKEGKKKS
jgi:26S proteasome regulatory subunit N8